MGTTRTEVGRGPVGGVTDDFGSAYLGYQTRPRSRLRALVRDIYLRKLRSLTRGPTLDYGCGAGELLALLPPGSEGAEINGDAVSYCRAKGYAVTKVSAEKGALDLSWVRPGSFQTIVLAHVLEHMDDPAAALHGLLLAGRGLGINRVVVVVPGAAGYRTDATHRTFVDERYLAAAGLLPASRTGWEASMVQHFPVNSRRISGWIPWLELQVVFERAI